MFKILGSVNVLGSFDVGCGISNVSVNYGNEVGFVALQKQITFNVPHYAPRGNVPYLIYADDLWKPYLPPVFGKYDDYGRIVDIKRSATVDLMEQHFNQPIETIMRCMTDNNGLYSDYSEIFLTYADPAVVSAIKTDSKNFDRILTLVGFVKENNEYVFQDVTVAKDEENSRPYNESWLISYSPPSSHKTAHHPVMVSSVDSLLELVEHNTGFMPGYPKETWGIVKELHQLHGMFFLEDVYRKVIPVVEEEAADESEYFIPGKQLHDAYVEWLGTIKTLEDNGQDLFFIHWTSQFSQVFNKISTYTTVNPRVFLLYKDNVEDLLLLPKLYAVMSATNKVFHPSFTGSQHGDSEAMLKLNKVTQKLLKKRAKRYVD